MRNRPPIPLPTSMEEVGSLSPIGSVVQDTQALMDDQVLERRKVADHLANERTFLAWIRTALAVVAFGAVLERMRRSVPLRIFRRPDSLLFPYFILVMGGLVLLGIGLMVIALCNFLSLRKAIEQGRFQPGSRNAILLTIISCLMAGVMALYLLLS